MSRILHASMLVTTGCRRIALAIFISQSTATIAFKCNTVNACLQICSWLVRYVVTQLSIGSLFPDCCKPSSIDAPSLSCCCMFISRGSKVLCIAFCSGVSRTFSFLPPRSVEVRVSAGMPSTAAVNCKLTGNGPRESLCCKGNFNFCRNAWA